MIQRARKLTESSYCNNVDVKVPDDIPIGEPVNLVTVESNVSVNSTDHIPIGEPVKPVKVESSSWCVLF